MTEPVEYLDLSEDELTAMAKAAHERQSELVEIINPGMRALPWDGIGDEAQQVWVSSIVYALNVIWEVRYEEE